MRSAKTSIVVTCPPADPALERTATEILAAVSHAAIPREDVLAAALRLADTPPKFRARRGLARTFLPMKLAPLVILLLLSLAAMVASVACAGDACIGCHSSRRQSRSLRRRPSVVPAAILPNLHRIVRDLKANTDNIKSQGNFGAQLWLIADARFLSGLAQARVAFHRSRLIPLSEANRVYTVHHLLRSRA